MAKLNRRIWWEYIIHRTPCTRTATYIYVAFSVRNIRVVFNPPERQKECVCVFHWIGNFDWIGIQYLNDVGILMPHHKQISTYKNWDVILVYRSNRTVLYMYIYTIYIYLHVNSQFMWFFSLALLLFTSGDGVCIYFYL